MVIWGARVVVVVVVVAGMYLGIYMDSPHRINIPYITMPTATSLK
jgi:hypothetical protein